MSDTSSPTQPSRRTRRHRATDAVLGRAFKLPKPLNDFTRTCDLPIPVRDGAVLRADHLAPIGRARGTILIRSPYGFDALGTFTYGGLLAGYGYHVVLARTRGTFGSGGAFTPFVHEVEDGADTVEWLRQQPFFPGRFATFGGSYLGFTQWALLMDPPPELATCVMQTVPHDMSHAVHAGGAFNLDTWLSWSDHISHQEQQSSLAALLRANATARRQAAASTTLPVATAADELCDGRATWFPEWAAHRDLEDPYWERMRLGAALDRVEVPVLLQTGWQDLFLDQTLEQYSRLRERGVPVGLTVGPWTHQSIVGGGYRTLVPEALRWLDEHLDDSGGTPRPKPVRIQVKGDSAWRELPSWPPHADQRTFHPHPDGSLGTAPAGPDSPPAAYTYDPTDPTPTVGGPALAPKLSGYRDDTALAARPDVLTFTSEPLPAPLDVVGVPFVELAHTSDNPHCDLFVRVSEVDPKGRSENVSEGFVRLDPERAREDDSLTRLDLWATAHRFAAGSRIRLLVGGGSFPRFERNLGTPEDPGTSTATRPSHCAIRLPHSRLTLPVSG